MTEQQQHQPLTNEQVATGARVQGEDTPELTVSGRIGADTGPFLILTTDEGVGLLVSEGHVRDSFEARARLTPEQRNARRSELETELAALRDQEPSQQSQPEQASGIPATDATVVSDSGRTPEPTMTTPAEVPPTPEG